MEELMIKAIEEFKEQYPEAEIRSVVVSSWLGYYQKALEASFEIEYVTEPGGQYYKAYIRAER